MFSKHKIASLRYLLKLNHMKKNIRYLKLCKNYKKIQNFFINLKIRNWEDSFKLDIFE